MGGLDRYQEKRDFSQTREPAPAPARREPANLRFVIQKHAARRLHYDLRLELNGVLRSWAVPKGPSLDPGEKRLAAQVEDHPIDYGTFEGVIADGNYGAGRVIVWDAGVYSPDEGGVMSFGDREEAEKRVRGEIEAGKLSFFTLKGRKLKGSWALVRTTRSPQDWLLIKHRDVYATEDRDVLGRGPVHPVGPHPRRSGERTDARPSRVPNGLASCPAQRSPACTVSRRHFRRLRDR